MGGGQKTEEGEGRREQPAKRRREKAAEMNQDKDLTTVVEDGHLLETDRNGEMTKTSRFLPPSPIFFLSPPLRTPSPAAVSHNSNSAVMFI